jgi:hypothetical protein
MIKFTLTSSITTISGYTHGNLVWFAGPIRSGKTTTMRSVEALIHQVDVRSLYKTSAFRSGTVEVRSINAQSKTSSVYATSSATADAKRQLPRHVASFIAADGIGDKRATEAVVQLLLENGVMIPSIINDPSNLSALIENCYSPHYEIMVRNLRSEIGRLTAERTTAEQRQGALTMALWASNVQLNLRQDLKAARNQILEQVSASGIKAPLPASGAVQAAILQGDPTLPCGVCSKGSLPVRAQELIETVRTQYSDLQQHMLNAANSLEIAIEIAGRAAELSGDAKKTHTAQMMEKDKLTVEIARVNALISSAQQLQSQITSNVAHAWYESAANILRAMLAPANLQWEIDTESKYALRFRNSPTARWVDKYGMSGAELCAFKIALQVAFVRGLPAGRRVIFLDDEEIAGFTPSPEVLAAILTYLSQQISPGYLDGVCIAGLQDSEIHSSLAPVLSNFERIYTRGVTIF